MGAAKKPLPRPNTAHGGYNRMMEMRRAKAAAPAAGPAGLGQAMRGAAQMGGQMMAAPMQAPQQPVAMVNGGEVGTYRAQEIGSFDNRSRTQVLGGARRDYGKKGG